MIQADARAVVTLRGPVARALTPDVLRTLEGGVLERWLETRRWYGGKGRAAAAVRIAWVVPFAPARTSVLGVTIDDGDGTSSTYQVPLALGDPDAPDAVALVAGDDGRAALVDAMDTEAWRAWLITLIGSGVTIIGENAALRGEAVGPGRDVLARHGAPPSRPLGAEQSNTSVLYGDVAILKLLRRLQPGVHPEIEVSRALGGRGTPALLGALWLKDPLSGEQTAAALVQRQVTGARDAWTVALALGRFDLQAGTMRFVEEARRIGQTTREMHDALARVPDEGFATRQAHNADVALWASNASRAAAHALTLLGEAPTGTCARLDADAMESVARIARTLGTSLAVRVRGDAGVIMRLHGDYHLGQVLRSDDGSYTVIDFEGEPTRPLEERRQRSSPLRDVAGMLRSLSYAAAILEREGGNPAQAEAWERLARAAFLDGYFGHSAPEFLPQAATSREALIELFELEKTFYELAYELENRPGWVEIPLRGVRSIAARHR